MIVQSVDMRMRTSTILRAVLGICICICGAFIASASASAAECPNQGFRTGPSSQLPDCRAYELVTPSNSNGRIFGDFSPTSGVGDYFPVEPWNGAGSSLIFATLGSSLAQPEGGVGGGSPRWSPDLYEAVREPSGWQTVRHLTPHPDESMFPLQGAFSPDHQYIFTHVGPVPKQPGTFGSLYQGSNADYLGDSGGHFELVGVGSLGTEKLAQGLYISPGGEHVIFSTGKTTGAGSSWCELAVRSRVQCLVKQLEANAPPNGTGAIYDRAADGPTKVVSLLPGNVTPGAGKDASYQGASVEGTVVAFKIEEKLFVRVNNEKTEEVAPSGATFGGLSADGEYLFYLSGDDIHRFDTATEVDEEINSSADAKLVNVSADGSHVYFISGSQLDGANGVLGQPNLYVWSGGSTSFVATVALSDTEGEPALTKWTQVASPSLAVAPIGPGTDPSRTTPDGTVIVFQSRKQLTPYDNAGHSEIYRFAVGEGLECVSCNPGGSAASSDARLQNLRIAHPTTTLHNLSSDGDRVFFETTEALVGADGDEINDVYEWQSAPAPGSPALALISSGASAKYPQPEEAFPGVIPFAPNSLLGISADGSDAFFLSQDSLAPGAGVGGAPAIYDARIGGGFPAPVAAEPCESTEGCRPAPSPAPSLLTPASATSAGNPKPRRCSRKHGKAARKHSSCRRKGR
jgi:hypothetical protein